MENEKRHRLEKLYVSATQDFLRQLKDNISAGGLSAQKERMLSLSRRLDAGRGTGDPSSRPLRNHD